MPNLTATRAQAEGETYLASLTASDGEERILGGKAAGLLMLNRLGFPTPGGVCLNAQALRDHLATIADGAGLERLVDRLEPVGNARFELEQKVLSARLGPGVATALDRCLDELESDGNRGSVYAVRSSAIGEDGRGTSFAGLHETVLGVARDEVETALRTCWASLWSERAIAYRREQSLSFSEMEMAVIIQKVIPARASAIAFTLNPVTGDRGEVMVNVAHGLGEPLVSGTIVPDTFVVEKASSAVRSLERGTQDFMVVVDAEGEGGALTKAECPESLPVSRPALDDLVRGCVELEEKLGYPVDVEAALVDDGWVFVQARPITTEVA